MAIDTQVSNVHLDENALVRISRAAGRWVKHRIALAQDRHQVRRLFDLKPELLDDIGLEPSDIAWALQGASDVLPSHRLRDLRSQRSRDRLARLRNRRRRSLQ